MSAVHSDSLIYEIATVIEPKPYFGNELKGGVLLFGAKAKLPLLLLLLNYLGCRKNNCVCIWDGELEGSGVCT